MAGEWMAGIQQPSVTCPDPLRLGELTVVLDNVFHLLVILLGMLMFRLINTCILFCLANLAAEQVKMLSSLWQQKDSSGREGTRYHQGWADMWDPCCLGNQG